VLRGRGLQFAAAVLAILLAHELGHFLAARRYRLATTPPFFLPAPVGLGTFGAFIRIRGPIRGKRELFDVGVAGPLAGFAVLAPLLVAGVARSQPVPLPEAVAAGAATGSVLVPGKCLAVELVARAVHGPLAPGTTLDFHPWALAAWFGLLATAINLLPLGQLDGGHLLYAVTGPLQRRLALPLWLALGLAGLWWTGWLVWCLIVLLMGLHHPPVRDERTPIGAGRTAVAVVALALFALAFMPVPLSEVALR
jgi:membrane-associated protease RseP (regulator of RpoE activity)